jgi:hypothetical protein
MPRAPNKELVAFRHWKDGTHAVRIHVLGMEFWRLLTSVCQRHRAMSALTAVTAVQKVPNDN